MEALRRSIIKSFSYRISASILTILIALTVTGRIDFAAVIGGLDVIVKLFWFFMHERIWNKIKVGTKWK